VKWTCNHGDHYSAIAVAACGCERPLPASIENAVQRLADKHGSLRAAARVLGVTPAYLCRLRQGAKIGPSDAFLRKLGLVREVTYRWKAPPRQSGSP
jgi:hypothetical protein